MSGEETILKEEKTPNGVEKAAVFQMGDDFTNSESNPHLLDVLKEVGLTADELRVLIGEDFKDAAEPFDEELPFNGIIEKNHVHFAQVGNKEIEVAHAVREEDSIEPPSGFDLQLRGKDSSYKILVGLNGEGVLRLPKTTNPAGMLYAATPEFDEIPFRRGTIAVIHAPTAWSFASSKKDLEYLYISYPRFKDSTDVGAETLTK